MTPHKGIEMAKAVLDQLNLVVADIEKSAAFYRRLGVEVPASDPGPDGKPFHVNANPGGEFSFDLDSAFFAGIWNKAWKGRSDLAGRVVVGFSVDTREAVDAMYADIVAAGYKGLQPPFDAFWGARYAIVEDPDGIAVGLMSPSDPTRRSWPPEGWPG